MSYLRSTRAVNKMLNRTLASCIELYEQAAESKQRALNGHQLEWHAKLAMKNIKDLH